MKRSVTICTIGFILIASIAACQRTSSSQLVSQDPNFWDLGPHVSIATISPSILGMPLSEQEAIMSNLLMMRTELRNASIDSIHLLSNSEVNQMVLRFPNHLPFASESISKPFADFLLPVAKNGQALDSNEGYDALHRMLGLHAADKQFNYRGWLTSFDAGDLYFSGTAQSLGDLRALRPCFDEVSPRDSIILSGKASDVRVSNIAHTVNTTYVLNVIDDQGRLRACEDILRSLDDLRQIARTLRQVLSELPGRPLLAAELPTGGTLDSRLLDQHEKKLLSFHQRHLDLFPSDHSGSGRLVLEVINLTEIPQTSSTIEHAPRSRRLLIMGDEGLESHSDRLDSLRARN